MGSSAYFNVAIVIYFLNMIHCFSLEGRSVILKTYTTDLLTNHSIKFKFFSKLTLAIMSK